MARIRLNPARAGINAALFPASGPEPIMMVMAGFGEKRFQKRPTADARTREELVSVLREELLRRPEIVFAYLHGSFVKEKDFRDIDLGIYLQPASDLSYELDLS